MGIPGQLPLEGNSFARTVNNPLRWLDPTGLYGEVWDDPNEEPPYVTPLPEFDKPCWWACVAAAGTVAAAKSSVATDAAEVAAQNRKRGLVGRLVRRAGSFFGAIIRAAGPIGVAATAAGVTNACAEHCKKEPDLCQRDGSLAPIPGGAP